MALNRYDPFSNGIDHHKMILAEAGQYYKVSDVEALERMYADASRAASDAGEIQDAYRSFIANKCLEYGFSPLLGTPFNRMVGELIERVKMSVPLGTPPNRLRRAVQLLVSAQVDLDALDMTELPRDFRIGGLLRTIDETIDRIERMATSKFLCPQCNGLGSPPGEAAGLICGECNGTGEKRRDEDEPD